MNAELTENGTFVNLSYHKKCIAELERRLAASQRREKAAVEDLRDCANCDSACKHGRCNDNDCEEHKGTLTELGVNHCFEWRGKENE